MQTLHQVLGRKDERLNLLNVGLCVLVVVILVTITFGVAHLRLCFQGTTDGNRAESVVTEPE